jgi:4-amino-4-deoxy-L-arabinose transferase-like glycosyltransferase
MSSMATQVEIMGRAAPPVRQPAGTAASSRTLWAIALAAVAVRAAAALYQGNGVEALPGVADQISYHTLATRVLEGHGFSFETGWWPATEAGQPTAHWSYLYVSLLTGIYALFGPYPLAARLIQAVAAGLLQTWLTFRIAERLFSRRAGLVSAALAAFNGYFVLYSGALMTEALYIIAVLWIIDISTAVTASAVTRDPAATRTWVLLGLALGAAALLRQVALLLVPAVVGFAVWHAARRLAPGGGIPWQAAAMSLRRVAIALAVLAVLILPWTIRNYRAFDSFVLLNTNAGFAFFWANHPVHGTRFLPILPPDKPSYGALIPVELRTLNEAAMDRELMRRGLDFVGADPLRYLRLSLSRAAEYFKFWPSGSSGAASNWARVLSYGILLPFLVSGVWLALASRERLPGVRSEAHSARMFVLVMALLYTLIHLLSWALIRYRLPVDAMTLPFTAFGVLALYDRLAARFRPQVAPGYGAFI